MTTNKCFDCKHFRERPLPAPGDECRRYAPRGLQVARTLNEDGCFEGQIEVETHWPIVDADDSCGEWEPAPVTAKDIERAEGLK